MRTKIITTVICPECGYPMERSLTTETMRCRTLECKLEGLEFPAPTVDLLPISENIIIFLAATGFSLGLAAFIGVIVLALQLL